MKINKTNNKLILLLGIFAINIVLQAILNYSIDNLNKELDNNNKQLENISILGENIVRDLLDVQAKFYQISTSTNRKQRELLRNTIENEIIEIENYLNILKHGGSFNKDLQTNLASHEAINTTHTYNKTANDIFDLTYIDITPKLELIRIKTNQLISKIDNFSNKSNNLNQQIDEIRSFIKSTDPLFVRTLENANSINFEYNTKKQELINITTKRKSFYSLLQNTLTIIIIILAIIGFYILARQINSTHKELEERRDYVNDILAAQTNIIIVNDGNKILDASGGFFAFFPEYKTIDDFHKDYACICDTFAKEKGYLQREINGEKWVDYVSKNPNITHKAKIIKDDKEYIFQAKCLKNKYGKYIISMFDITHLEELLKNLEKEKNKAIKATKSKSEFLANMSHEIRTPLNAILGFITLLQDKKLDVEGKKFLKTIDSSGQTLLAIINDVLDFSKIESGKLIIDEIIFNPQDEFKNVAELFKNQCYEKYIKLHINLDKNLPQTIQADILRVKQIITNLLSNAVKFSPKNTNIFYNLWVKDNKLYCEVIDEGIGIKEEKQKLIFEAFSQEEGSITRKFGGTGLGLSISAKLVQLLGGEIKLKSKLNKGSSFSFNIPIKIIDGKKQDNNTNNLNNSFGGCILLVEDNLTNQMLMKAILAKQGIDYEIAGDGDIAVEMFKKNKYDLILMDENMPKMQGTQATKIIREYEKQNNLTKTPIVALTASTIVSEREKFYKSGMDDYLSKPIELPRLIEVFTKFLPK